MNAQRFVTRIVVIALALVLAGSAGPSAAQGPEIQGDVGPQAALGTAFTYQGRLTDGGHLADGLYDFQFRLYDAASGGTKIGSTFSRDDVTVTEGVFSVLLDFGTGAFTGDARYLQVSVRPGSSTGTYTFLSPRQTLTPAPYAIYAAAASWGGLTGVPGDFADEVDDDTTYTAGNGLLLNGTRFKANYGGDGAAVTISRSDHDHLGETWDGSNNPLIIRGSFDDPDDAPIILSNTRPYGAGLKVEESGGSGVYIGEADGDGIFVWHARTGMQIVGADAAGIWIASAGTNGVGVGSAREDGLHVDYARDDGLQVDAADDDGVYVASAGGHGVYVASAEGNGVYVQTDNTYANTYVKNSGSGTGLYAYSSSGVAGKFTADTGEDIIRAEEDLGATVNHRFEVKLSGEVRADGDYYSGTGGYKTGFADLAEMLYAAEGVEPADVLVVGADGRLTLSTLPNAFNVAGVYSTQPGFVAGYTMPEDRVFLEGERDAAEGVSAAVRTYPQSEEAEEAELNKGKIPLAIAGVVPVKVCAENGPIQPGDLLTTSSTAGHAMKAMFVDVGGIKIPRPGTIIGKALASLTEGTGIIRVLVTLQ